jgi:hypothetical protein
MVTVQRLAPAAQRANSASPSELVGNAIALTNENASSPPPAGVDGADDNAGLLAAAGALTWVGGPVAAGVDRPGVAEAGALVALDADAQPAPPSPTTIAAATTSSPRTPPPTLNPPEWLRVAALPATTEPLIRARSRAAEYVRGVLRLRRISSVT